MYNMQTKIKTNDENKIGSIKRSENSILPWKVANTHKYARKLMDDRYYFEAIKTLEELPQVYNNQILLLEGQALLMKGYSRAIMQEVHSGVHKNSQMIQKLYQKGTQIGKQLMAHPQYETHAQSLQEILNEWTQ